MSASHYEGPCTRGRAFVNNCEGERFVRTRVTLVTERHGLAAYMSLVAGLTIQAITSLVAYFAAFGLSSYDSKQSFCSPERNQRVSMTAKCNDCPFTLRKLRIRTMGKTGC